ncbi:MAG TPA: ABC transporter permease [Terriglobales bacterium]|nr:ABC transporter permease [Terriglobales bacterium]
MEWLRKFSKGLQALFRKQRDDQELDDEIGAYVEAAAEKRIQAGSGHEDAYRTTRAEFGSVAAVKDYVRDAGWETWLENLARDLRYALRMLRRTPGFSAIVILTLALGIGANTALFSLVNAVLLRPLAVKDANQLVLLSFRMKPRVRDSYVFGYDGTARTIHGVFEGTSFPYLTFQRFSERHDALSDLFGFAQIEQLNVVANSNAEIASGQYASGGYFKGLGLEAWRGRLFTEADDQPGSPPVAVITWQYWQRHFGGEPRVVGMPVTINNVRFTIVGVTPPGFVGTLQFDDTTDVTVPLSTGVLIDARDPQLRQPGNWWVVIMGRLKPGMTREQVQASLEPVFQQSVFDLGKAASTAVASADYPHLVVGTGAQGETDDRQRFRQPLIVLMAVVGLVLLIACINVANLLLARSASRQQEIAMRLALGARRSRLLRQLLTESLLLALIAGGVGCLLAYWGKNVLAAWSPFADAQLNPALDLRVLSFTVVVSLFTGILFGLAPALRSSRTLFTGAMKSKIGNSEGSRSLAARSLTVTQVGVSLVLLIAAGLFIRTLRNLSQVNVGFDRNNLLLFRVKPQTNGYSSGQVQQLYDLMLEQIARTPGVESVALSRHPLLARSRRQNGIFIPGRTKEEDSVLINIVSPSFFATMPMPVVLGRALQPSDTGASPKSAVVNQAFVRKYFPDVSAVGQRFWLIEGRQIPGKTRPQDSWEIVGVSRDAKYTDVRTETLPTVYQSYLQEPTEQANFEVRFRGDEASVARAVREAVRQTDSALPIFDVRTQSNQADESLAQERLFARLSSSMSLLALMLAAIGLYGTMSYAVVQRTQEIGIRLALGAQHGDVIWMVLRESLTLVLIGVIVGLPLALAASHAARSIMATLLFGVQTNDPATMLIAILVLGGVALLAGLLPASRAAKTDPMIALRAE